MKLRKILAGFLAGAVAMSSMVFTSVTASAAASAANTTTLNLASETLNNDYYSSTTQTVTFTGGWQSCCFWIGGSDHSYYDSVTVEYSALTGATYFQAIVEYANGTANTVAGSSETSGTITVALDETGKTGGISQIMLQTDAAGSVKIDEISINASATAPAVYNEWKESEGVYTWLANNDPIIGDAGYNDTAPTQLEIDLTDYIPEGCTIADVTSVSTTVTVTGNAGGTVGLSIPVDGTPNYQWTSGEFTSGTPYVIDTALGIFETETLKVGISWINYGTKVTVEVEVDATAPAPSSYAITSSQTNGGSFAVTLNNDPDSTEVITEAEAGDEVYIFFNPNIGYELIAYMIRGRSTGDYYANVNSADSEDVSLSDTEYITFEMPEEPVAIVAYFGMVSYDVTVLPYENGTVFADNSIASYGDEIKITATPSSGYEVSSIVVKDTTGKTIATTDTFLMPDSDVTVEVVFTATDEEDNTETGAEDDFTATVIDLGAPTGGWDATFDDATDTINISNAWGGMTWDIISDCSDYSKIVLKYSDSTLANILLTVTYSDNTQDFQTAKAANGEITLELDDAKKSDVLHVNIGGSSIPGSIKIISIELIPEPMFNKTAAEFEAADAGKIVAQTAIIDGAKAMRFTMLVGMDAIEKAEKVTFTLNNGTTTKTYESKKYYTALSASGATVNAPEGYGFVSLTVTDIPDGVTVTCTDIEFTISDN